MACRADFHCHSTASDSARPPAEVVRLAYEQGVRILALTDHDSTEGVAEARQAAAAYPDFTLIPGVEMGTDIPGGEVHVVGLFLEPDNAELQATLRRLREGRVGRGRGMVEKLRAMGLDVTWEQVQKYVKEGFLFFQAPSELSLMAAGAGQFLKPLGKAGYDPKTRPLY